MGDILTLGSANGIPMSSSLELGRAGHSKRV